MNQASNIRKFLIGISIGAISILSLISAVPVYAQTEQNPNGVDYKLLEPLPYIAKEGSTDTANTASFIAGFMKLLIGIAGALTILMIMWGGIEYMTSEGMGGKKGGKDKIKNALIGFVLTIGAYTILYTVNPQLVNFSLDLDKQAPGSITDNDLGNDGPDIPTLETAPEGCATCVVVTDNESEVNYFPHKPIGAGCGPEMGACYIDQALGNKLHTLNNVLKKQNVSWWVTEMIPQTTAHVDDCHKLNTDQTGKCVDAALRGSSYQNAGDVLKFMVAVTTTIGNDWQYEVPNVDNTKIRLRAYAKAHPEDPNSATVETYLWKIVFVAHATAEHMHINYP